MRVVIVGPGRAGGSIALAAIAAGHEIVGVASNNGDERFGPPVSLDLPLPEAELALICVKDDQIESVAGEMADSITGISVVAHVSGFLPTTVLNPLAARGVSIGGFHPLQTLPDPVRGAAALSGSYFGIGGDELAQDTLIHFGSSLGMEPFRLDDEVRPLYHAASAAAANFVATALATASDLYGAAKIDPSVAAPLVERISRNVFESGGRQSLTGPIARGDTDTVIGHLVAAHEVSESVGKQFRLMAEATAILAGRFDEVKDWK
jgi:predicted short-subunit dehydrogenase-like oxidoreductase (DUF2520 family)